MTPDSQAVKIRRSDDAVWRVIDGEVVLLIPEEATIHALTGCGSRVWELIEGETTISAIVDSICVEYDVDAERAAAEVTEFIRRLASMNIVETVPQGLLSVEDEKDCR
jgi:hypothetical protein